MLAQPFPLNKWDLEASSHWLVSQDQNPSPLPQITGNSNRELFGALRHCRFQLITNSTGHIF